jgi:hypothetical protein
MVQGFTELALKKRAWGTLKLLARVNVRLWEIEPRLRPLHLANPEEQNPVPFRVVRIARKRGLALLFPATAPVAGSWRGR